MTGISQKVQTQLIQMADGARQFSYSPYSKFRVGAAALLSDGTIETGINIENASYGLSICAERVAFSTAIAKGKREFVAVAVVASSEELTSPCGACRQFMAEFNGDLTVIMANDKGSSEVVSLRELLPYQFDKTRLP